VASVGAQTATVIHKPMRHPKKDEHLEYVVSREAIEQLEGLRGDFFLRPITDIEALAVYFN
jgi:hypothetical protein